MLSASPCLCWITARMLGWPSIGAKTRSMTTNRQRMCHYHAGSHSNTFLLYVALKPAWKAPRPGCRRAACARWSIKDGRRAMTRKSGNPYHEFLSLVHIRWQTCVCTLRTIVRPPLNRNPLVQSWSPLLQFTSSNFIWNLRQLCNIRSKQCSQVSIHTRWLMLPWTAYAQGKRQALLQHDRSFPVTVLHSGHRRAHLDCTTQFQTNIPWTSVFILGYSQSRRYLVAICPSRCYVFFSIHHGSHLYTVKIPKISTWEILFNRWLWGIETICGEGYSHYDTWDSYELNWERHCTSYFLDVTR